VVGRQTADNCSRKDRANSPALLFRISGMRSKVLLFAVLGLGCGLFYVLEVRDPDLL